MKKRISLCFVILVLGLKSFSQIDTTAPYFRTKSLPPFSLLSIDSVAFTQDILDSGKNTILMLFNPTCEHCRKQMERFLSMPEFYGSVQLVLISIEDLENTRHFSKRYHLGNYPFIHIGKDFKRFFISYFMAQTIPVLAFYNKKKELVFFKQGDASETEIREALK
jgi:thiol-disulfide isomerase/thioredoxin